MAESRLSPILQALYGGDREEAARLRSRHPDVDVFDAAALGDVARLAENLDADADAAQAWSVDGFTALHYAAYFGGPEATHFLIENGADIEAPSRNVEFAREARPLHGAVAAGDKEAALVLLEAGADPNARQHGGFTPLMAAEQSGDLDLADILIRYGARAGVADLPGGS